LLTGITENHGDINVQRTMRMGTVDSATTK